MYFIASAPIRTEVIPVERSPAIPTGSNEQDVALSSSRSNKAKYCNGYVKTMLEDQAFKRRWTCL